MSRVDRARADDGRTSPTSARSRERHQHRGEPRVPPDSRACVVETQYRGSTGCWERRQAPRPGTPGPRCNPSGLRRSPMWGCATEMSNQIRAERTARKRCFGVYIPRVPARTSGRQGERHSGRRPRRRAPGRGPKVSMRDVAESHCPDESPVTCRDHGPQLLVKEAVRRRGPHESKVDHGKHLDAKCLEVVLNTAPQLPWIVRGEDLPPGAPCRTDLAHQHEIGRVRRQRLSDELVHDGGSVILSRIDVIDAAVDGIPQEGNGLGSVCRRSKYIWPRKPHGSETNWRTPNMAPRTVRLAARRNGTGSSFSIATADHYPYAGRMAPLTGAATSLTRKAMMSAIASGATARASISSGSASLFLAVSISWGATPFTRIPTGRNSTSRRRIKCARAALLDGIRGHPHGRLDAGTSCDVHDRTGALPLHVRSYCLAQPKGSPQVHIDHCPQ